MAELDAVMCKRALLESYFQREQNGTQAGRPFDPNSILQSNIFQGEGPLLSTLPFNPSPINPLQAQSLPFNPMFSENHKVQNLPLKSSMSKLEIEGMRLASHSSFTETLLRRKPFAGFYDNLKFTMIPKDLEAAAIQVSRCLSWNARFLAPKSAIANEWLREIRLQLAKSQHNNSIFDQFNIIKHTLMDKLDSILLNQITDQGVLLRVQHNGLGINPDCEVSFAASGKTKGDCIQTFFESKSSFEHRGATNRKYKYSSFIYLDGSTVEKYKQIHAFKIEQKHLDAACLSHLVYACHRDSKVPGDNCRERIENGLKIFQRYGLLRDWKIHAASKDGAVLYNERTREAAAVTRGSNMEFRDWLENLGISTKNYSAKRLNKLADMIDSSFKDLKRNNKVDSIFFTGHSLGGSLASVLPGVLIGRRGDVDAYSMAQIISFDAPELPHGTLEQQAIARANRERAHIDGREFSYYIVGDLVQALSLPGGKVAGRNRIPVDPVSGRSLGFLDAHSILEMIDAFCARNGIEFHRGAFENF